jgi:hypothetical protein
MNNQQRKFKKGDRAFWLTGPTHSTGSAVAVFHIVPVRITSWGTRQGTAVRLDDNPLLQKYHGNRALTRFYTQPSTWGFKQEDGSIRSFDIPSVLATREEVEALAAELGPVYSAQTRLQQISNNERWLQDYRLTAKPHIVEKAERELAALKAEQPSYNIVWREEAPANP